LKQPQLAAGSWLQAVGCCLLLMAAGWWLLRLLSLLLLLLALAIVGAEVVTERSLGLAIFQFFTMWPGTCVAGGYSGQTVFSFVQPDKVTAKTSMIPLNCSHSRN
jgi:hypothetical protein